MSAVMPMDLVPGDVIRIPAGERTVTGAPYPITNGRVMIPTNVARVPVFDWAPVRLVRRGGAL